MSAARTPMLFVTHESTRTGAPMMLLHFLRWARDNTSLDPRIATLRDGELTADFAEVGPTTVLGETVDWPAPTKIESDLVRYRLRGAAAALTRRRVRAMVAELRDERSVYLNSVASLRLLHHLPAVDTSILHVHELESALRWSTRPEDRPLLRRVDHVVAAADCVADNLVRSHRVDRDRITRVYELIDTEAVLAPPHEDRDTIRSHLGLAPDTPIVGGSGFADWRKGIDLFVQLARTITAAGRDDVHFVWVGARAGGSEHDQLDFDLSHSGAEDRIHLAGLRAHPFDWYRAFDVLALTSREDPYPLVGLETSVLGVPMVCFADSGGMTELVARTTDEGAGESGVIVGYVDVEAMAEATLSLLDDPDRRAAMGRRASDVVRRDHEVEVAGPLLVDVIERALGRSVT